jgi:oligoendopeptidase F
VIIGKGLEQAEEEQLIQFLNNNQDVFAWSSTSLKGVSGDVMEHVVNVDPKFKLVRQHLRTMSEERKKVAQAEVQKLLDAGVIREMQFSDWLANVVMVPKNNGKWQMCIDLTNLNKAYPKDHYPLP